MLKKFTAFLIAFITGLSSFSQSDSLTSNNCHLRISLLTCTPGTELYSTFGHSALRVVNSKDNTDIIFNYGTFDFNDPDFYKKFTLGKLLYFVSIEEFSDFVLQYQYEGRGIVEQDLNLSCDKKNKLLFSLFENAKEENKYYKYDFAYDNCTTRLRDLVASFRPDSLITKNILPHKKATFRNLLHEYLDKNQQNWSKLGIDILLGKPMDKMITNSEAMFLPDYLMKAFDSTISGNKSLVTDKKTILNPAIQSNRKNIYTPLFIFSGLFLLISVMSFINNEKIKFILIVADIGSFLTCGALGMLILFMWFGTGYEACRNNYNFLWALPIHFPAAFLIFRKSNWRRKYFRLIFGINIILLLVWFFLPQQLNIALLPFVAMLTIRSFFLSKKNNWKQHVS